METEFDTARDLAQRCGGHLLTITSEAEQEFVVSSVIGPHNVGSFWLGIGNVNGGIGWLTGEPMVFSGYPSPKIGLRAPPHYVVARPVGTFWAAASDGSKRTDYMRVVIEWDDPRTSAVASTR